MSRLGGNPVKAPNSEPYVLAGRLLGGSGVVTIKEGVGFSVTYVSAGRYQVKPDINYNRIIGGSAVLMSATDSHLNYGVGVKAYAVGGGAGAALTIDLELVVSGTPTDMGSAEEMWFVFVLGRSSSK